MRKVFGYIKKFFAKNYWLQPVLLVAAVFLLVFSIQWATELFTNISDELSGKDKCNTCTDVSFADAMEEASEATDDAPVFVLVTTDDCAECVTVYTYIDRFLRAHPEYKVFRIEIQENADETQVGKEVYDDETLTKEKLDTLKMDVYDFLKYSDERVESSERPSASTSTDFALTTPTLIRFGKNGTIYDVTEKIHSTSSSGLVQTYDNLVEFFEGAEPKDYVAPFPWWGWALCIGGGAGIIFAVVLFVLKRKKK